MDSALFVRYCLFWQHTHLIFTSYPFVLLLSSLPHNYIFPQPLGLNISQGNKSGIGCEIIITTSGYTYYIP